MKRKEFDAIVGLLTLNINLQTEGNVPKSLLQAGNGMGFNQPVSSRTDGTPWTLEQHFNLCEEALANGASFAEADKYCQENCGMNFGTLYNFIQLLRNPLVA